MKLRILFLSAIASSVAFAAPRKIWTWNPGPHSSETISYLRGICVMGSDANGNTGFVMAERAGTELGSTVRYRIVWISAKGAVLKDDSVDASGEEFYRFLNIVPNDRNWTVLSVSASTMVVSNDHEVRTYTLKGKTVSVAVRTLEISESIEQDIIKPDGKPEIAGWFERRSEKRGQAIFADPQYAGIPNITHYLIRETYDLLDLSAWLEK